MSSPAVLPSSRPAVFLDRDGTIIEDTHFVNAPEKAVLMPGAAAGIGRLNRAGYAVVVVTNQSGIARGIFTEETYQAIARRVEELLAVEGARLDGQYHCPHLPEVSGPCECRKPGTLLYRQAAEDLSLDLPRSWWIGDRLRDLEASRALGGRGLLVLTGKGPRERDAALEQGYDVVADLAAAAAKVLGSGYDGGVRHA